MSTFTAMKTTLKEEATIPMVAVHAFQQAFEQASASSEKVTYVENQQLLELENGQVTVVENLSGAYVAPKLKRSVLRRKKKQEVMA